jgi:orotate phosphoribosyltransferase
MLAENGLELHYLLTWWDILRAAREGGNFNASALDQVESFLNNPLKWSAANGGISELGVTKK